METIIGMGRRTVYFERDRTSLFIGEVGYRSSKLISHTKSCLLAVCPTDLAILKVASQAQVQADEETEVKLYIKMSEVVGVYLSSGGLKVEYISEPRFTASPSLFGIGNSPVNPRRTGDSSASQSQSSMNGAKAKISVDYFHLSFEREDAKLKAAGAIKFAQQQVRVGRDWLDAGMPFCSRVELSHLGVIIERQQPDILERGRLTWGHTIPLNDNWASLLHSYLDQDPPRDAATGGKREKLTLLDPSSGLVGYSVYMYTPAGMAVASLHPEHVLAAFKNPDSDDCQVLAVPVPVPVNSSTVTDMVYQSNSNPNGQNSKSSEASAGAAPSPSPGPAKTPGEVHATRFRTVFKYTLHAESVGKGDSLSGSGGDLSQAEDLEMPVEYCREVAAALVIKVRRYLANAGEASDTPAGPLQGHHQQQQVDEEEEQVPRHHSSFLFLPSGSRRLQGVLLFLLGLALVQLFTHPLQFSLHCLVVIGMLWCWDKDRLQQLFMEGKSQLIGRGPQESEEGPSFRRSLTQSIRRGLSWMSNSAPWRYEVELVGGFLVNHPSEYLLKQIRLMEAGGKPRRRFGVTLVADPEPDWLLPDIKERFIRGKPTLKASRQQALNTNQWRAKYQVDRVLEVYPTTFTFMMTHMKTYLLGVTPDKSPVLLIKLGTLKQLHEAMKAEGMGPERMMEYLAFMNEYLYLVAGHYKLPGGEAIQILDCKGLTMSQIFGDTLSLFKVFAGMGEYYPERLRRAIILHSPSWFQFVYNMVSPFVDPVALAKVSIVSSKDSARELAKDLGAENVPEEYGGPCQVPLDQYPEHIKMLEWVQQLKEGKNPFNEFKKEASLDPDSIFSEM